MSQLKIKNFAREAMVYWLERSFVKQEDLGSFPALPL